MKPHKHAELIKAWADGAKIQINNGLGYWINEKNPKWNDWDFYRVKPKSKKDIVKSYFAHANYHFQGMHISARMDEEHNLILIFDGETGELKSAEVM